MTSMHFIGLDIHKKTISYCVKDVSGKVLSEGPVLATRIHLDQWMKTLPAPWTVAMEATMFTGWIYDHLLPHAAAVKVAHPLMLRADKPPKPQSVPGPFIYTRGQVKDLLHAAEKRLSRTSKLGSGTLRMMLLTLYATGCSVDEVFKLRRSDVDFKNKQICFKSSQVPRGRCIPIGGEFRPALAEYISAKDKSISGHEPLFVARGGEALKRGYFYGQFRSCNVIAGVSKRSDGRIARPRDLRFSFAVHRISQCIRKDEDLNRLLPALSTYMGYSNLTKSEQFLAYAPDRFRQDLRKLSPAQGARHWRDDASLIDILQRL